MRFPYAKARDLAKKAIFDRPSGGHQRGAFGKPRRTFEERNRDILNAYKRLKLAEPADGPGQWVMQPPPADPKVITIDRNRLKPLTAINPPYEKYSDKEIEQIEKFETFYDPLFNPHLHEERHRVNPEEEPFNAIYTDHPEYTKVRDITTPTLWEHVERLARIKVAPEPPKRKANEKPYALPSGYVPPPESPPDLPYFVARTRNYLLPVYYSLHSDPEKCFTVVRQVSGDLWKLEQELRTHLESLSESKRRILTSVHETDERVLFRGRYIHQVVDWLHEKGF